MADDMSNLINLLSDLRFLCEDDRKLRRLRRQVQSDPSKLPAYLRAAERTLSRAEYGMEVRRLGGGDKDLVKILQVVGQRKRPPRALIYKVKRRLRKMPGFVQRLYAVSRMAELLRDVAAKKNWSAYFRMPGEGMPDTSTAQEWLRDIAARLDKLPTFFRNITVIDAIGLGWGTTTPATLIQNVLFNTPANTGTSPMNWPTPRPPAGLLKALDEWHNLHEAYFGSVMPSYMQHGGQTVWDLNLTRGRYITHMPGEEPDIELDLPEPDRSETLGEPNLGPGSLDVWPYEAPIKARRRYRRKGGRLRRGVSRSRRRRDD